jgi:hypothetical protein
MALDAISAMAAAPAKRVVGRIDILRVEAAPWRRDWWESGR